MSRSLSRVTVVAFLVVAFAAASLPAYGAAPFAEGKAAAKAESGWIQAAFAWVSEALLGGESLQLMKSPKKLTGSCIDPLGRCS